METNATATAAPPSYPMWVRLGLKGAPTRKAQRNFALFATAIGAFNLGLTAWNPDPMTLIIGIVFTVAALRNWLLIRWMDARQAWS